MTKNPIVNALVAALYIVVIATIIYYGPRIVGRVETVFVPIAMISLFTLSTAVMGYLFLLQPAQMYLDGQKKEAVNLFLKTLLSFASITILIFASLFLKT